MALQLNAIQEALFKNLTLTIEGTTALRTNYSIALTIFAPQDLLPIPLVKLRVMRSTVMVFADDEPLLNWAHRCRYLLFDLQTLELYRTVQAHFPPEKLLVNPQLFRRFHSPVQFPKSFHHPVQTTPVIRSRSPGNRYALLLSGKSNGRHVNDMHFLYQTLVREFKYEKGNIRVLNYDNSTQFDLEVPPASEWLEASFPLRIDAAGTKAEFVKVFDWLALVMEADDSLLIHTSNHGDRQGLESYICYYDSYTNAILASEFAAQLARLPVHRSLVVMMEQCYSGGFVNPILDASQAENVSIATACASDKASQAGDPFNPFAKHWISALAGYYPHGTPVHVGSYPHTTMKEAFEFAANSVSAYPDTPQESYRGDGAVEVLGQTLIRWPDSLPLLEPIIREHWPLYSASFDKILEDHFDTLQHLEKILAHTQGTQKQAILLQLTNSIPTLP